MNSPPPPRRGCRHPRHHIDCDDCRRYRRETVRWRRRMKTYNLWEGLTDPQPAADHATSLVRRGMSQRDIAAYAGVARHTVGRLVTGTSGLITPVVDHAVRGVQYRPPASGLVPTTGTIRRLRALAVNQWGSVVLGRRLGARPDVVRDWRAGRNKKIHIDNHNAIRDLYELLQDEVGPSASAATHAAGQDPPWVGPDAWSWTSIEDPDASPYDWDGPDLDDVKIRQVQTGGLKFKELTPDERVEIYRQWVEDGGTDRGFRSKYKTRVTQAMVRISPNRGGDVRADTAA